MSKLIKVLAPFFMLSGSFVLMGCESDFDKCMDAELPRALAELQPEIETEEWNLAQAKEMQPILEVILQELGWDDPRFIPALNAAGVKGTSREEIVDSYEKIGLPDSMDRLARIRAHDLKCFNPDMYDASSPYEPEYSLCDDEDYDSLARLEIKYGVKDEMSDDERQEWSMSGPARLTQHFADKIELIKAKAPENATLACNGAGIYE